MPSGKGYAEITASAAAGKIIEDVVAKTATLEVYQDLIHNPAVVNPANATGHVVLSWISLS